MLSLRVNRKTYSVDAEPETPLLWVIRDTIGLTGTKFGCGKALCGACTVHVNGKPIRSCVTPASQVVGQEIVTIEGLLRIPLKPISHSAGKPITSPEESDQASERSDAGR